MGCDVKAVSSADGALAALRHDMFDLAFLDLRLGEANGIELIPKLLAEAGDLIIVMMTAFATIDSAVDAIKRGAANYLPKPFQPAQIRHVIDQYVKQRELRRHVSDLESRLREAAPEIDIDHVKRVLEAAIRPKSVPCSKSPRAPPHPTLPSCCAAKAAPARPCWRARFIR